MNVMSNNSKEKILYLTKFDLVRLQDLLVVAKAYDVVGDKHLDELQKALQQSKILPQEEMPSDIVTMNTKVVLTALTTIQEFAYTLVYPSEASIEQNKVSILSPMGTSMIGCKVGDIVEWQDPAGLRRMKIINILYQPEAAGDYHL